MFCVCSYHFSINSVGFNHINKFDFESFVSTLLFMINATCIPIFLMVNGALLLSKPIDIKKHIKKCLMIFVNFYIWRIITILSIALFNKIDLKTCKSDLINSLFFFRQFPGVDLAHFWFIPMLISIYIIFPFIALAFQKLENHISQKYISVFMIALFIFTIIENDLPTIQYLLFNKLYIDSSIINDYNIFKVGSAGYLFYFLLGSVIEKNKTKLKNIKWYFLVPLFFVGLMILFCYWHFKYTSWDYIFNSYNMFPTMLMSSSIFLLSLKIPNEKIENNKPLATIFKTIGSNTMVIYYTHWILGYTIFADIIPHIQTFSIWLNFIKSLIFVIIGTLIGWSLKKLPKLNKYLT